MSTATARREGEIRVQGLHKTFLHEGKKLRVLKGIDVEFARGEMVSIQGRSGAGKSTFLHVLGTLDRPTSGRIYFGEQDVFRLSSTQLARFRNANIGFVFQFHHLLPEFTAIENVMMPAMINRLPRSECLRRAQELLESVGLQHRLAHKPGELSGGEQQRVALARALVMEPSLLLADEPTGNLDNKTGSGIHDLFYELNRKLNLTIVVVTHDPNLAESMPRRLYMEDGGLITAEAHHALPAEDGGDEPAPDASEETDEDVAVVGNDADEAEAHADDGTAESEPDADDDETQSTDQEGSAAQTVEEDEGNGEPDPDSGTGVTG